MARLLWSVVLLAVVSGIVLTACSGPERDVDATPGAVATATAASVDLPPTSTVPPADPTATMTPVVPTPTATIPADTPAPTATTIPQPEPTATAPPPPTATTAPQQPSVEDVWTVRRFEDAGQVAVLTFDAGADRGYAEDILDVLAAEGIEASFGMTGGWAEQNPDLILRIVNEGHDLINHTWTHGSFTGYSTGQGPMPSADRRTELVRTENLIRDIAGVELQPYFRPPYGDYDDSVLLDLAANGYTVNVMWTIDTLGWNGLTATEINQRVWDGLAPGAIILMHVGAQSQDAVALPDMIAGLRERGYSFATVDDLVRAAGWE
jgi:peptidoglycan-N-acetylglucosamine deacetylase